MNKISPFLEKKKILDNIDQIFNELIEELNNLQNVSIEINNKIDFYLIDNFRNTISEIYNNFINIIKK